MTRPDFITPEQIAEWDEQLENDTELLKVIPKEALYLPELKEMFYAGRWLMENLTELGYDKLLVGQIQYAHGMQSFGNDPWEIAKIFVDAYKYSAPIKKVN